MKKSPKKPKIDKKFIKERIKKIGNADIEKVLDKKEEIENKIGSSGPLKKYIEDVKILFEMVKDYWYGNYKTIPFWVIASVVFALLYVLSPIDLIPDVIPVIGLLDDAAVMSLCLLLIEQQLYEYKEWKLAQEGSSQ